jgi:hypothetical protein
MDKLFSFKTSVKFYQTTQCHNPKDSLQCIQPLLSAAFGKQKKVEFGMRKSVWSYEFKVA